MVKYGWEIFTNTMRRPILIITALLVLFIIVMDSVTGYDGDILTEHAGETVEITGTAEKVSKKADDYYQIVLDDICLSDGKRYERKVLIHIYDELEGYLYLDGCRMNVRGEIEIPEEKRNPGCFDYRKYLKSTDIRVILSTEEYEIMGDSMKLRRIMTGLRGRTMESLLERPGGDAAGIMIGMMFGDKDYISDETMEMFRKGGTAHVLAVSGLHVGIIYGFLLKLRRKKKSRAGDVLIASFLIFYAALCWFTASVMRAVLMILIHMAGNSLNRRYDFTCGICASMILFLILNPYQIFNAGFQMSYLAAFVIAFVVPVMSRRMDGMMMMIVTMQIGMGPYIAYVYNYVSIAALLCNIPVSIAASFIIPAGICLIPLCFLGVEGAFSDILGCMADLMIWCNELSYADGMLSFDCISPPLWLIGIAYAALFYLTSESGRISIMRGNRKKVIRILAACLAVSVAAAVIADDGFGRCEYTFVDVGQGDCLHVREAGMNVLIDGGGSFNIDVGEKTLKPYLLKNGAGHVDIAVATHLHMDHFQGLCELSRTYRIDTLAIYEGNMDDEKDIRESMNVKNIIYLKKGDEISLGKHGKLKILAPEEGSSGDEEDENANSLVIYCIIDDVSVMMTGDLDEEGERELMRINDSSDIKCSVLKVSHHGSRFGSCDEFIEKTDPDMAVISVGKNNYGHPAQETLDRLSERNIPVYRTDQQGAIGIDVDRKKIHTMRKYKK